MATIIKAADAATINSGKPIQHTAFEFSDMSRRADQFVGKVQSQAEEIVDQAQRQAQAIRKRAEHEGQQSARKAVQRVMEEKVDAQLQTLMPSLQQAIAAIEDSHQAWLNHWQQSTVQLATRIAERIVRREIAAQPEITLDLVKEALQLATGSSQITIRMNPQDLDTLHPQVEQLTGQFSRITDAELTADPTITPGGCRVETQYGVIDQQIESQLGRIAEELIQ